MNKTEFKAAANAILADPLQRLSPVTKDVIDRDNYVFDAHMHIFDRKCTPVMYFLLRFMSEKLKLSADDSVSVAQASEKIYDLMSKNQLDKEDQLEQMDLEAMLVQSDSGTGEAVKIVLKKEQSDILEYYNEHFALNKFDAFKNKEFLSVVLSMDLEVGWGRKTKRTYKEQIADLKVIAKETPILPFFAIDPRRADLEGEENLYKMFIDAFTDAETPFFGVKCYPSLGYLPSDARLIPIYEVCEAKNIPIITHCGGTAVSTYKTSIEVVNSAGKRIELKLPAGDRAKRANYLNDPLHWDSVLSRFPKLKINLAHFGGPDRWNEKATEIDKMRVEQIIERMQTFGEQVYTDFSFNIVDNEANRNVKDALKANATIKSRLMYGTDYWVVLPGVNLKNSIQNFINIMGDDIWDMVYGVPNKFLFGIEKQNQHIHDVLEDIFNTPT